MSRRTDRPAVGELVSYRPAATGGTRTAVVVGYPERGEPDELHLAVLMSDQIRLDLLALSVPYSADRQYGTWTRDTTQETWPDDAGHDEPHEQPHPDPVGAVAEAG